MNTIKPVEGSGDGMTEYAYQIYNSFRKRNKVDIFYSIEKPMRNNISGLLKSNVTKSSVLAGIDYSRYDIFHIANQEMGFAAKDAKSKASTPVITTIHDLARFIPGVQKGFVQNVYSQLVKSYVKDAVHHSDFLLFDSHQTKDDAKRHFKLGRYKVVSLGIKNEAITAPKRKRYSRGFVVGYLGSFAHNKNAIMLARAASLIRKCRVEMYGTGAQYGEIERMIAGRGLSNVKLMGFAPENRKVQIYDGFDVFVFPSLYEGFGLPVLEAQARGLPVIVYKHGKVPEEVRRYCFEAKDEEDMARIIERIRQNGYNEKARKKATAYARSFTWERCARETLRVYNSVR